MADLGLSTEVEKQIFLEVLKRDFVFRLMTDKKSDIALTGFPQDFSYTSKAGFSYVIGSLNAMGIPAKDAFWGGIEKPLVAVAQDGPIKIKFTTIIVYKKFLREFVQMTGVDFVGKKALFPDLV